MALLSAGQVSVRFGGLRALHRVDLSLNEGEILALIGPNGAGKTTLINVLTRLVAPDEGQVLYRGEDLLRLHSHDVVRKGIARTFQNIELFPRQTVLDNVLIARHVHLKAGFLPQFLGSRQARQEDQLAVSRASEALEFVGLGKLRAQAASSLSYGQRKLIELARALAAEPKLLLLDEPAAGLSGSEVEELMLLLRAIRADRGVTIFLVEHVMKLVMRVSDRIVVLHYGERIAEGSPGAISKDRSVIEAYLGRGDVCFG
jgi:ABC-type branched-subunit amino acid transport system ATPase component